eukprot:TRINITY_DN4727_c0_g1_i1.p1 TRINITY_DN4727_c0_g1~~TRINITY_DN4727_c0_g1_i1.p1  ORF type:complete len:834 (-),score=124.28 TRINITY_DN4727_c0_g1_i1:60-2561(-)
MAAATGNTHSHSHNKRPHEDELFDHVLVIQLQGVQPKVTYKFPPGPTRSEAECANIAQFCFPDAGLPSGPAAPAGTVETFSFVLTAVDGSKRYGYCRRFMQSQPPECYCIVSLVPSFAMFTNLLGIIAERRKASSSAVFAFLRAVLANPFPAPGKSFVVKTFSTTGGPMDEYTISRPAAETLIDYVSLSTLLTRLTVGQLVELWGHLLCERRVIIASHNLEVLSATVNALSALLYPFSWQHVFIPILPSSLIGYVSAPMPFLIGCLHSSLALIKSTGIPLEEVVLVDVDTSTFVMKPSFEDVLPPDDTALLRNSLVTILADSTARGSSHGVDTAVARAFLYFFHTIMKGYPEFMTADPEIAKTKRKPKPLNFNIAAFIASRPPDRAKFLSAMENSQIFWMFIEEREDMAIAGGIDHCVLLKDLEQPPYRSCSYYKMPQAKCEACGGALKDTPCSNHAGRVWHTKCFTCARCRSNLEGAPACEEDGQLCCASCSTAGFSKTYYTTIDMLKSLKTKIGVGETANQVKSFFRTLVPKASSEPEQQQPSKTPSPDPEPRQSQTMAHTPHPPAARSADAEQATHPLRSQNRSMRRSTSFPELSELNGVSGKGIDDAFYSTSRDPAPAAHDHHAQSASPSTATARTAPIAATAVPDRRSQQRANTNAPPLLPSYAQRYQFPQPTRPAPRPPTSASARTRAQTTALTKSPIPAQQQHRPQPPIPQRSAARATIVSRTVPVHTTVYPAPAPPPAPLPQQRRRPQKFCPLCGKRIDPDGVGGEGGSDEVVCVDGCLLHVRCFTCARCGQMLSNELTHYRGRPYHTACLAREELLECVISPTR